jgi:hypothetical protein
MFHDLEVKDSPNFPEVLKYGIREFSQYVNILLRKHIQYLNGNPTHLFVHHINTRHIYPFIHLWRQPWLKDS